MNRYYAVLGLPSTASKDEVKKAYRKLVLIWHPDKNSSPGAATKFMQITEAYDVLMGERPALRTYTSYRTSATTKPKSPFEQRQEKRKTKAELTRKKFEQIRRQHLTAVNSADLRARMYLTARLYFGGAALLAAIAILGPILLGGVYHVLWALPLGLAGGGRMLWTGGRYKLRADMIFGNIQKFSDEDISEFFVEGFGVGDSASGDSTGYF